MEDHLWRLFNDVTHPILSWEFFDQLEGTQFVVVGVEQLHIPPLNPLTRDNHRRQIPDVAQPPKLAVPMRIKLKGKLIGADQFDLHASDGRVPNVVAKLVQNGDHVRTIQEAGVRVGFFLSGGDDRLFGVVAEGALPVMVVDMVMADRKSRIAVDFVFEGH